MARRLRKRFKKREVVKGIELEVRCGEIVGLLGPNGAGKTTTFYMIAGFLWPDEGQILLDEKDLTRLPVYKRARKGLVYLPQEPSVFRRLTVEENVKLVLEEIGKGLKECQSKLEDLLSLLSVEHLRHQKGYSLSGGERRRVEIVRALATEPRFLLLDEPFAGIDPLAVADLKVILKRLKEEGLGLLISDHNVRETLAVCDRAYIVAEGKIIASGSPEEIVRNEKAQAFYLGKDFTF